MNQKKFDTKSEYQALNTEKWDKAWSVTRGNEYPHEQLVKYVNIIGDFPVMKALDIGFGGGANMKFLHEKGFQVYGVEVSKNSLEETKQKAWKWGIPFDLRLFTPPTLPFDEGTFGFICSIEAIYYTLELEKMVEEVHRVLAPGGKMYISFRTPNHGVVKDHAEFIDRTLMEWKKDMPTKEMAGVRFRCFEDKDDLYSIFSKFSNVRVDTLWTDLLGKHFELLIVTGEKS